MAKPRVFIVVGLPHAGVPLLTAALDAHRDTLAGSGVRVPATSDDEMFRAAVELRREHRAWGLRRRDVEGAWARVARRATKRLGAGEAAVLGHELLAGATADQVALLVDALRGCAVHVVVAVGAPEPLVGLVPAELDLADVLVRWSAAVKAPERVHLVVTDPADPAVAWRRLGEVLDVDVSGLPTPDAHDVPARLDTTSLRLLADATHAVLDHDEVVDLAEHWAKAAAEGGYDVRGDLATLVPTRAAHPTEPSRAGEHERLGALRAALAETVAEVGRLRDRLAAYER